MTVWSRDGEDLLLSIRLTPGAAREDIGDVWTDAQGSRWLGVRVRAVPEKGRANGALIALLAKWMDWPRSAILLESGDTNRLKRLRIKGGGEALVFPRLSAIIKEQVEAA